MRSMKIQGARNTQSAPLVDIGLTVMPKNWGRAKAWSAISYILLISTLSLHGKKGDAAISINKMCVHFQNIKFGVRAPLVEIGTVFSMLNAFERARITKPLFCPMNMLPNWSAFLSLDSASYK